MEKFLFFVRSEWQHTKHQNYINRTSKLNTHNFQLDFASVGCLNIKRIFKIGAFVNVLLFEMFSMWPLALSANAIRRCTHHLSGYNTHFFSFSLLLPCRKCEKYTVFIGFCVVCQIDGGFVVIFVLCRC